MLRTIWFMAIVGVLSLAAVWFAEDPGSVILDWRGSQYRMHFSTLLTAVAALAIAVALLYRLWLFIRRSPSDLGKLWSERRRRKGYLALTRGMVAVAAGDADEAGSQSKRAEVLLEDPPLTMLLSAQAAQLGGDEKAAGKFFGSMREDKETEFLGLRGLLTQAMKEQDWDGALELAARAYKLRPNSGWVANNLFDLQTRTGNWKEAQATLEEAVENRVMAADNMHRRAVLEYQMSVKEEADKNDGKALKHIRRSNDLARDFIPASIRLARMYVKAGKNRKAAGVVICAWKLEPHPDLLEIYWQARNAEDAMAKLNAAQALAKNNPSHLESHLAIARASLDARLWGEARKHLAEISDGDAPARVCRMMAELEELEHGDQAASRAWLMRGTTAEPDPAWVCDHCGNTVDEWAAICGKCEYFDAFTWRAPPHIVSLAGQGPIHAITDHGPDLADLPTDAPAIEA